MDMRPTEDEVFLQGIVNRPSNQLHRLVYADWLEERGDPRHEFMRLTAEMDVAIHRMVDLATVLPEEWVEQVDLFRNIVYVYRLPNLGSTVEAATIKSVSFRVGDRIDRGRTLFTVETDMAVMELTAPMDLRAAYVLAGEYDTVVVGSALAVFLRW